MKKEDFVLGLQQFCNLKLENLETDRVFLRNVHLTVYDGIFNGNRDIRFCLHDIQVEDHELNIKAELFRSFLVSDDPGGYYFFSYTWPEDYQLYLKEEDVIDSFVGGPNLTKENLKRILGILQSERAVYKRIFKPHEIEADLDRRKWYDKNGVAWSRGIVDWSLFETTVDVMSAWAGGDQRLLDLLIPEQHPFTKPLLRSYGGPIERFNSILGVWERVLGNVKLEVDMKVVRKHDLPLRI